MKAKQEKTRVLVVTSALAALTVFSFMGHAGSLEPSGSPGPTMKTLEQIEPRIIANALSGDVDAKLHISQPGNYYLIADIISVDNNKHGIKITADDVTLDLNGFVVASNVEVTSLDGIHIDPNLTGVTISNGTVRDFQGDGVDATDAQCRLEQLNILRNGVHGVLTGAGSIVLDCTVFANMGWGMQVEDTLVHSCSAIDNSGGPIALIGTSSGHDNNW
jgi:hypothetical protein